MTPCVPSGTSILHQPALRWLTLLLGLLASLGARAQVPAWQAALTNDPADQGTTLAAATVADAAGNVFIAGSYTGTVRFGSTVLTSRLATSGPGDQETFVAKWSTLTNAWVWAMRAGGAGTDIPTGLALSGSTLYVVGQCVAPATFGGMPLSGTAGVGVSYLVKISDAGPAASCTWTHSLSNVLGLRYAAVAVSGSSVYVGGSFQAPSFSLDGIPLTNAGNNIAYSDALLFKVTDGGNTRSVEWARSFGNTFSEDVVGVAASGNRVYLTGSFSSATLALGSITLDNADAPSTFSNFPDVYLAALTDAGTTSTVAWAHGIGGANTTETVLGVAVSGTNVYLAGSVGRLPVYFGGQTVPAFTNQYSSMDYVAKLSDVGPAPTFTWVMPGSTSSNGNFASFAVTGSSVYLGGYYSGSGNLVLGPVRLVTNSPYTNLFVARLDDQGSTGTYQWAASAGTERSTENTTHVAATPTTVVMLGRCSGPVLSFGSGSPAANLTLPTGGPLLANTLIAATLSPAGVWQVAQQPYVGGTASVTGMATDDCGMVYMTGNFMGRVQFGDTIINSQGGLDVFVAKWNPRLNAWAWVTNGGGPGGDLANGIAVHDGNVFVVGTMGVDSRTPTFSGEAYYGSFTLTTTAIQTQNDAFILKVRDEGRAGRFAWARRIGYNGDCQLLTVATRGSRVYAAGYYNNVRFMFGTTVPVILPSTSNRDHLVLRLTDLGNDLTEDWAVGYSGRNNDVINAMTVRDSVLYLAGTHTLATTTSFQPDTYVGKMIDDGPTGRYVWHKVAGQSLNPEAINAVGVSGNMVYVAGTFSGTSLTLDAHTLTNTNTNGDGFVAALADAGPTAAYAWTRRIGGTGTETPTALAASGTDVYVAGISNSPSTIFASGHTLTNQGGNDAFVYKLREAGVDTDVEWVQRMAGTGNDALTTISASADQLLVAGGYVAGPPPLGLPALPTSTFGSAALVARLTDVSRPASFAGFTYRSPIFCQGAPATAAVPSITGTLGGRFAAAPAGLVLNARTGAVNVAASAVGTYTITYTVGGDCPATFSRPFTITTAASAAFAYPAGALCAGSGAAVLPTLGTGASAGSFSTRTGLALQATTGAINPAASTAGTYVVTNSVAAANGCAAVTSTATVVISPATSAAFSYGAAALCQSSAVAAPSIVGTAGGTFAAGSGLMLDAATGIITPGTSTAGTYTVTYSVAGPCPSSSTQTVTIVTAPLAAFSYAAPSYCLTDPARPAPTLGAGAVAGTFSAPAGLLLNASTGVITPLGSTPGMYIVTNTLPTVPGCGVVRATASVIIAPLAVASFTYPNAGSLCQGATAALPTITGTAGGRFAIAPATGLLLDPATGALTLAGSTLGNYVVTYTAGAACPASSTQTLTVTAPPAVPTLNSSGTPATGITLMASGGSSYQFYLNGQLVPGAIGATLFINSGALNGSYTVTTTNAAGCTSAPSASVSVVVTATAAPRPARTLLVYPNPSASGQLTLALAGPPATAELRIYNALGQLMVRRKLPATTQPLPLDLSGLPVGVYLLRVGELSQRWVRE